MASLEILRAESPARDNALHEGARHGERRRALGGVQNAQAAAGPGADVEEASAPGEARGDSVDRSGDVGQFGRNGGSDAAVLLVDHPQHVQRGEGVDML